MQLFYNPDIDSQDKSFVFNAEESKHIVKVLRKKEGDLLFITNGKGWLFNAVISSAHQKKCTVLINSSSQNKKHDYYLHLAVAPTKMNDRFEWFLEKATEIGIDEITPIICDHSERKIIKPERFEKIIQSAMKQSLNTFLPKLNPAVKLADFIGQKRKGALYIAHCEESHRLSLKNELRPKANNTILIGPEGDFSEQEIKLALLNKFVAVSLGATRLRTETAAIVACHTAAIINEPTA